MIVSALRERRGPVLRRDLRRLRALPLLLRGLDTILWRNGGHGGHSSRNEAMDGGWVEALVGDGVIAITRAEGKVAVWNVDDSREVRVLANHPPGGLRVSTDGRRSLTSVLTGREDSV